MRIRLFAETRNLPNHQRLHGPMMCVGPKGPDWFGASLKQKEDDMKLVSRFEAASRSRAELYGLLAEAFNAFAAAPRSSQQRRDALTSMRNIENELGARTLRL
jgi:hypothetical protein